MMRFAWFLLILGSAALASGAELPRSTPEAQGLSSLAVREFVEQAQRDLDSLHSVMIVRHGHVVAAGWWAPYNADSPHSLFSLSKSFTSTAVGLAVDEEKLSIDDPVLKFFPDDASPEPSENLRAMRVRDLLTMNTGHQTEPPRRPDGVWTKDFLAQPVPFKPGTHFLYNTSATYMLSAIVQKVTGKTVLEYLGPRLFEPLGIKQPTWEVSPQGINTGGYGLSVRTEDIARFGQLYLQHGQWEGKQLVPAAWIAAATAKQVENGSNPESDWNQGYGFQFWRCRHGAFRGDGAFGQFCVVLPEQDAVIAITSGVKNLPAVLNLVWDKLLPAMKPAPLPPDPEAVAQLDRTLKGLSLRGPSGMGKALAAVAGKKYVFAANERNLESLTLAGSEKEGPVTLSVRVKGADQRLECGHSEWRKGKFAWGKSPEQPVAAWGDWTADDTYTAHLCFYETPFITTLKLKFTGNDLQLESETNVALKPTPEKPLVGHAE